MTSSIAAVFVPQRSVRLFILAILAVCAAGLMALPSDQTKFWIREGVSRLDHNDTKNAEICFLIAYDHAQKSRKRERYKEYCSYRLAEIYESTGRLEEAEKMLKANYAIHANSGCSRCVVEVADKRRLARVLGKQGRLTDAHAILNELFESTLSHLPEDAFLDDKFLSVEICSTHCSGCPVEAALILQASPTPCRLHKSCEHDVEVEALGQVGHREASACRIHKFYPPPVQAQAEMNYSKADEIEHIHCMT
jgi:tetratricopeptide (TPR) repeat protein